MRRERCACGWFGTRVVWCSCSCCVFRCFGFFCVCRCECFQDTSESEHADELLRLLFVTPTPLRYVIIEAFIGFRQAAADLGKLLTNEPIWSRLLSPLWVKASNISDSQLRHTQKTGEHMLQASVHQLNKDTISLSQLHTILDHQQVATRS